MPISNPSGGGGGGTTTGIYKVFNVKTDYSAAGNGTTDDTTAIQNAVTAASASGGIVFFPIGTYKITATVTGSKSNVWIVGSGHASIIKMFTDTTSDIFSFDPGVTPTTLAEGLSGIKFSDLRILSNVARTAGYAIHVKWSHNTIVENVVIDDLDATQIDGGVKIFGGIKLENQSACHVIGNQVMTKWHGLYLSGDPLGGQIPTFGYNGEVYECDFWGAQGANGHHDIIQGSAGVYLDAGNGGIRIGGNCNMSHYDYGIFVNTGNREVFLGPAFCDGNASVGTYVLGATILQLDDHWGAATGGFGVSWAPVTGEGLRIEDGIAVTTQITGGRFYQNNGGAIYIGSGEATINGVQGNGNIAVPTGGDNLNIDGVQLDSGSIFYSATGHTITVSAAQAQGIIVASGVGAVSVTGGAYPPLDGDNPFDGLQIDPSVSTIKIVGVQVYQDVDTVSFAVGSLPAGSVGMRTYANDVTIVTFGGTPVGGGSNRCPVFWDDGASAWKMG